MNTILASPLWPISTRCCLFASFLLPPIGLHGQLAPPPTQAARVSAGSTASAPDAATVVLSPFQVQSSATGGYGAQFSSSSSRLNLRYLDVPQSVNVVTQEFLQDANLFDSRDFIKYVSNVLPRNNAHQTETFFIRGLQTTQSYVDSFAVSFPVNRDSALIDRVEYVKGPASAAMGRGEAGGLVNFVSKSPMNARKDSYALRMGTDSFYRAQFDHNDVLGTSGKMAYRIPVYYEKGDNPRGGTGGELFAVEKIGAGPSFVWHVRPGTDLLLNSSFFRYEGPGVIGAVNWSDKDIYRTRLATGVTSQWTLFRDPFVDPRTVNGFPGANRTTRVAEGSATVVHKFSRSLSFRGGLRAEKSKERYIMQAIAVPVVRNPADPTDYLVSMTFTDNYRRGRALRGQGDLLFDTTLGSTKHQALVGYDGYSNQNYQRSGSRGGITQSMYRPSLAYPPGFDPKTWVTTFTTDLRNQGHGFGYYAQYSGSFFNDHIAVMGGWRKDRTTSTVSNFRTNTLDGGAVQTTDVPRYSITYKPTNAISIYYLHSEQADPMVNRARYDGFAVSQGATVWAATDPRHNERVSSAVTAELEEVGAKTNLLGEQLTISAALYSIKRTGFIQNRLVNEPGANGVGTLTYNSWATVAGETSQGFEVEVFGRPLPRLTLTAAYGGIDGTTVDPSGVKVTVAGLVNTASVFGKYSLLNSEQNGFIVTAGGKLYFKGWLVLNGAPTLYSRDQYFIDAGITYQFMRGQYSVGLSANNLTDQSVVLNVNSQLAFRRVLLTFSGKF